LIRGYETLTKLTVKYITDNRYAGQILRLQKLENSPFYLSKFTTLHIIPHVVYPIKRHTC